MMKIIAGIIASRKVEIFHGDNFGTKKLQPKFMNNGNNQEGIGIYFGTHEVASTYGKDIVKVTIDKDDFIPSRDSIVDHVDLDMMANIMAELHKIDNEPLYYYITDFGIELDEPEDVEFYHIQQLADELQDEEVRNFQIDMAERFTVESFVDIWNKVTDIHGTYSDDTGFYAIINTNYKLKSL